MPPGYRWDLAGHYRKQQEAFASLLVVMVVAVLLVFIMLAFQFRSVALPLLIFLTQPLSLVSGLFALWLTGTPLNVSSYMGAILLISLVKDAQGHFPLWILILSLLCITAGILLLLRAFIRPARPATADIGS